MKHAAQLMQGRGPVVGCEGTRSAIARQRAVRREGTAGCGSDMFVLRRGIVQNGQHRTPRVDFKRRLGVKFPLLMREVLVIHVPVQQHVQLPVCISLVEEFLQCTD